MCANAELVEASWAGDGAALGLLLERHRAWSYVVALGYLHDPAEAQDAVQEAFLAAIEHVGDLRDPRAFTHWLGRVVSNVCLARLRSHRPEPFEIRRLADRGLDDAGNQTERTLEARLLGDWVWGALHQLPEHLRLVVMLRHFGQQHAYAEIAVALGIPVGTVRSRLAEARRRLGTILLASVDDDWEMRRRATAERRRIEHAVMELARGRPEPFTAGIADDVRVVFPNGSTLDGRDTIAAAVEEDLAAGISFRLAEVLHSPGITVIEGRFDNPADDPAHCPSAMTQIRLGPDGTTTQIRVLYSPRTTDAAGDRDDAARVS